MEQTTQQENTYSHAVIKLLSSITFNNATRQKETAALNAQSFKDSIKAMQGLGFVISKEFIAKHLNPSNKKEYMVFNNRLNRIVKLSECKTDKIKRYHTELRNINGNLYQCHTAEVLHLITA